MRIKRVRRSDLRRNRTTRNVWRSYSPTIEIFKLLINYCTDGTIANTVVRHYYYAWREMFQTKLNGFERGARFDDTSFLVGGLGL